jgi:hypothetical protein
MAFQGRRTHLPMQRTPHPSVHSETVKFPCHARPFRNLRQFDVYLEDAVAHLDEFG